MTSLFCASDPVQTGSVDLGMLRASGNRETDPPVQGRQSVHQLPQHFLNFLPLPHGQGSLRVTRVTETA